MASNLEEIILEIENTPIVCKKNTLISNSDYFKAMLEGNFVEKRKQKIKLEGVNLKSMNIILTLVWDETLVVEGEDILQVLQTACMLQFVKIKQKCVDIILQTLSPENCLEVWHVTERLDIKLLYVKAKAMALEEFLQIKDNDYIFELTINDICYYLGHIYLKTDNELSVFETAIKWWYQNGKHYNENSTKYLLKLLSCIAYQDLLDYELKEIMIYPELKDNLEVIQILSCILSIKNRQSFDCFSEVCQETSRLLLNSQSRISPLVPCILANFRKSTDVNKPKVFDEGKQIKEQIIMYYDNKSKEFKKYFDIDGDRCQNLTGFKLTGYKEFVFMYGGEFLIGRGNWNTNFWVYDTIREKWERKSVVPFVRRHFESCMVNSNLYIISGTGMYRLLQENIVCYNFKNDKWSNKIELPCTSRQLKCCNLLDKCFILNINNKCGYFFNDNNLNWNKIIIKKNIPDINSDFAIFSNKSKMYIKGEFFIEFVIQADELVPISIKNITKICYDKMEIALCNDIVYTLYKSRFEDSDIYSLETYDLQTGTIDFIFKDVYNEAIVESHKQYSVNSLNIFPVQYYKLVEKNTTINNCFD